MADQFENQDMSGAVFHNVNLHKAAFDDVNLEGATIRNANLHGVSIADAYIAGMTIFGLRIDELIEAEFDRRDPERVALRMADVFDPGEVARVMARLAQVRAEFATLLRTTSRDVLTAHPAPERWSALEHVRHLVFAEDMYLNRWLLRNDQPWCLLGFLPPFLTDNPAFVDVGSEPTDDLDAVLAAWDAIDAGMKAFVVAVTPEILKRDTSDVDFGQGTVGHVLQGMAQHDLAHIRMAEAALA